MKEQEEFLAWHQAEVSKGLVDLKFYAGEGCFRENTSSEDFFREANFVNALIQQGAVTERPDVF